MKSQSVWLWRGNGKTSCKYKSIFAIRLPHVVQVVKAERYMRAWAAKVHFATRERKEIRGKSERAAKRINVSRRWRGQVALIIEGTIANTVQVFQASTGSKGVAKWEIRERLLKTSGNASGGMHKLHLGKSQITVFSNISLALAAWSMSRRKNARGPKTIN